MADGYRDRFEGVLGDEAIDELVDLRLRREFGRAFPAGGDPVGELHALVPAMRRARTVHRLRSGALGVAAAFVLVAGVGAAMTRLPDRDDQMVAADAPRDGGEGEPSSVIGDAIAVTGTTSTDDTEDTDETATSTEGESNLSQTSETDATGVEGTGPDGAATDDPATTAPDEETPTSAATPGTGTTASPGSTAPTSAPPTVPSTAATTAPNPVTTGPAPTTATTQPPTSAPPTTATGDTVVTSRCGSISVSTTGVYVFLEDTDAEPEYKAEVKSNGPYTVEVEFDRDEPGGTENECEITARVIDGSLSTYVED